MSEEHQPAVEEIEVASPASSDSDSAADMNAILVVHTAAVALSVSHTSGGSFDL